MGDFSDPDHPVRHGELDVGQARQLTVEGDVAYVALGEAGVESERAQEVLARLYKPFTLNGHPVLFMDVPSAEMTKYAANAMLATRISFMNEIANLCERLGADVDEALAAARRRIAHARAARRRRAPRSDAAARHRPAVPDRAAAALSHHLAGRTPARPQLKRQCTLLNQHAEARVGAQAIGAGHSFILFLGEGFYPINVLNAVKNVPEVVRIFCATANPTEVLVAQTEQGRGILGVIDGSAPQGVEDEAGIAWRRGFLRKIGYKF